MLVVFIVLAAFIFAITLTIVIVKLVERGSNIELNRGRCNYKVRFNPKNNKYYLTNASNYGDIDVAHFGLFRVYYKSKITADFVMQKLNDPS